MASNRLPLICLFGPTASGKTELALRIAQAYPVRLISVDSAMIYRSMDIGTAKPDPHTLAQYPHDLIDICDPMQSYSAAQFVSDVRDCVAQAERDSRIPLLVGGTMLYFKALRDGLAQMPSADPDLRAEIEAFAAEHGWPAVHAQLARVDPQSAERLHPNDPQRVQRALEVNRLTGKTMAYWWQHTQASAFLPGLDRPVLELALVPPDRTELHQQIELRFMTMLTQGFVDEVAALRDRGDLNTDLPSIRCVGYRQIWAHLEGDYGHDEMVRRALAATRQLAKRQHTWLRGWFSDSPPAIEEAIAQGSWRCETLHGRSDAVAARVLQSIGSLSIVTSA